MTVYQAFPTPTPPAGPVPVSVRRAVYLMYAGAAISLISGIVGGLAVATAIHGSLLDRNAAGSPVPGVVASTVTSVIVVVAVFSTLVTILLWLWMPWKCKAGRPWARIVSTVLFGLATFSTLITVAGVGGWGMAGDLLSWLVGLGATILLWQRPSSSYFRAEQHY